MNPDPLDLARDAAVDEMIAKSEEKSPTAFDDCARFYEAIGNMARERDRLKVRVGELEEQIKALLQGNVRGEG